MPIRGCDRIHPDTDTYLVCLSVVLGQGSGRPGTTRTVSMYCICVPKHLSARLDGFYFKVEGNQGKYEALQERYVSGREELRSGSRKTHLQVLYEIVENTKAFRIFAVLNVHQRTDLCRLSTVNDQRSYTRERLASLLTSKAM